MIEKTVTTAAGYTLANTIGPDPSGVLLEVLISGQCTIELFRGQSGQQVSVGEVDLDQSYTYTGATGCRVKDRTAGTHVNVTMRIWQTKDPLPAATPVGAAQITPASNLITGDIAATGAINAGTGFTAAGTTAAAGGLVITFTSPFSASPTVAGLCVTANNPRILEISALSAAAVTFKVWNAGGVQQAERIVFIVQSIV